MGLRLSLYILPRSKWKRLKHCTNEDAVYNQTSNLKRIVYDYCTDAMWDIYSQMPRLTKKRFPIEEDMIFGVMAEKDFCKFAKAIQTRMENNDHNFDKVYNKFREISKDKWLLTEGITWMDAYYSAVHIFKTFDWKTNVIFFKIA